MGYHLPEWLVQLDPNGVIVPDLLIQRFDGIKNTANEKSCYLWLRHIGAHHENSPIWRKLAIGAKKILQRFTGDDRRKLLLSMSHNDRGVWSGTYGEFHPRWQQAIDREAARVASEGDPLIKEFFEIKLAAAKADFENEKLRHAEEHEDE